MIPLILLTLNIDDRNSFAEHIFLHYRSLICSEIHKFTQDNWATDDILQTALIKLIKPLDYLMTLDRDHLVNYIIKTTHNAALDHLEKEKRQRGVALIEDLDSESNDESSVDFRLLSIENAAVFMAAWNALEKEDRTLLNMKYVLHKPNEEIASFFGVSSDSVRMMLSRARNRLKECLAAADR